MFFANDLKHVSSTAKLLSIKLYNMYKTGYRQVYNIQDKLFYSEMKFIANIQELKIINVNIILESKICTTFNR